MCNISSVEKELKIILRTNSACKKHNNNFLSLVISMDNILTMFFFKVLVALLGMSHARDEIYWLLRHKYHPPPKGKKIAVEDFEDE